MAQLEVSIGGRSFEVACQDGEEHFLTSAAKLLDAEASVLIGQIGRLTEARMLLMAGLMLADKTAGLEDKVNAANERVAGLETQVAELLNRPAPEPKRTEVAVVPPVITETLAELAARAEAIAEKVEEKISTSDG
ncbi:cell division protein ZapA [Parasulfitobacter algicola]|uniref:Cell division protein ZapA n=1 Tax=Parasulfitobacter algicola TaxID=2614809 RepID=A0ABX2IQQ5_9RHOB|nr:cell division protein ZapA [Sulfitobacter algicola]NSX55203.1 cell division protein ZapA [Sulfitobacter algicola]